MKSTHRHWSRLQRQLYNLLSDSIDFQVHCVAYRMDSQRGSRDLPRTWITLNGEIIWDYPKQFVGKDGKVRNLAGKTEFYPYNSAIIQISDLLREYVDTPKDGLLTRVFENDHWGLVNVLRAADRRVGVRRLDMLARKTHNIAALKVIEARKQAKPPHKDNFIAR